jgi:hypothetical protein
MTLKKISVIKKLVSLNFFSVIKKLVSLNFFSVIKKLVSLIETAHTYFRPTTITNTFINKTKSNTFIQ